MEPKDLPCICIRLRRSSQALTALYNQALEANGLTISQYQLMEKITKNPGCSTSQIANEVHLERSTLARNLSRLAAEGMIMDASLKGKRNSQWHLTQQDWKDIVVTLRANGTKEVAIEAERKGVVKKYTLQPEYDAEAKRPLIGITPKFEKVEMSFTASIKEGVSYTKFIIISMVDGLSKIITGKAPAEVSGPLGVAQMAGQVAEKGLLPLMNFVAFLSINLGVINLLPLPALDGGHFVLLVLEALRGKPLGAKAMNNIQTVGVVLILALTIFSTVKDITR